jgi:uncharacterized membrane protein YfcA
MLTLTLTLSFLVVALAAYVQASVGFAYALLTAPLLQLVAPDLVPGPVLFSSLALSGLTAWREREWLDRRGVSLALLGRVPGALLAGLALGLFATRTYDVVFGSLIIVATFVSFWGGGVRPTPVAVVGAGFVSGFMGTLTSVGGPPMALVYQNADGPTLRSTLNAYFAVGATISIGVLAAAGRFGLQESLWGIAMLPPLAVGFYASRFTRGGLDGPRLRPILLSIAALSSLAVVVRALLS